MKFNNDSDPRDSKPDYFDGEDIPEPKKEHRVHYPEDDPRYWEEEDKNGEWDHLRPLLRRKFWILAGLAILVFIIISMVYIRWFRPYATGGIRYGYVENIQEQGVIFKTYEGILIPYRNVLDTTRAQENAFAFTAVNDIVAADLKRALMSKKPVKVEYTEYNATLPWRGDSKLIITSATPANPGETFIIDTSAQQPSL